MEEREEEKCTLKLYIFGPDPISHETANHIESFLKSVSYSVEFEISVGKCGKIDVEILELLNVKEAKKLAEELKVGIYKIYLKYWFRERIETEKSIVEQNEGYDNFIKMQIIDKYDECICIKEFTVV